METKTKLKPLSYYMTLPLSRKMKTGLVKNLVNRTCGSLFIDIPDDLTATKNVLFVLPEDTLDALHQIVNIISILNHVKKMRPVHAFFLCEQSVAPYFSNFQGASSVIEYDKSERYLFSRRFLVLYKQFKKEYIDLCLFLERKPDLSLLYLIGRIQAKIRVSYADTGEFPFFNFQIKPKNPHAYLTEQNTLMAKMLGAKPSADIQWSVSKETMAEVTVMLKESSLQENEWVGGIDARFLYYSCGAQWSDTLIAHLCALTNKTWYLYAKDIPQDSFFEWLRNKKMPVFSDLSPPRIAGLLKKTDLFISGKAETFALANLLHTPAIGIFEKEELQTYCSSSARSIGIPYTHKPDDTAITGILDAISVVSAKKTEPIAGKQGNAG